MGAAGGRSVVGVRIGERLERLYGRERGAETHARLRPLLEPLRERARPLWDERDVVLIAYGDTFSRRGVRPLAALREFARTRLADAVSVVHVLPFFPFSSDDGFAVIDYRTVHPMLGDWDDIAALGDDFGLMFDFVLNHVSSRSRWFTDFLACDGPGKDYFIEVDPDTDVSGIVRPRVRPLLAGFDTEQGEKFVWATFGEDQIDLDFSNPDVLVEMVDVFVDYLRRGARIVRLDAVAFLWKRIGTPCIHLDETHEVVKLLRDVADCVSPGTVLLTETNVPHAENLSYLGDGDEAHMVYQFALPPLVLHALWRGTSHWLSRWAETLEAPGAGRTYLNFTASHDGIGMRPAEGLLPMAEIDELIDGMRRSGAYVSARDLGGGRKAVYEINTTWFDALKTTAEGADAYQIARTLCSQLIAVALRGVPALYAHTLTATPNDHRAVDQTGRLRAVNRHRWDLGVLDRLLDDPSTPQGDVFAHLVRALAIRRSEPAFHPDGAQEVIDMGERVFAFSREAPAGGRRVSVVANVTAAAVVVANPRAGDAAQVDLLTGSRVARDEAHVELGPYQVVWLAPED